MQESAQPHQLLLFVRSSVSVAFWAPHTLVHTLEVIVSWQQGVLADFESIMKRAHTKEAASLPRQPAHVTIDIQATGGHRGRRRTA
jgi:hypothetical protein